VQFQQEEGVGVQVSCPDGMALVDGATYTCTGVTADGERVRLTLRITDAGTARYTWSADR
jgi:TolB-like protein